MALRLGRSINQERTIPLGYGVTLVFKPFTYAQYKEARAAAHKMARANLSDESQMAVEFVDDEDMPEQVEQEIQGRIEHYVLVLLIVRYCSSWEGLLTDDEGSETLAPINLASAGALLDTYPGIAEYLGKILLTPHKLVAQEGNGFAPLPSGASAAG
ncbi:hypothetical protein [Tritonibacter mobilis]|uniref:hypothetical protein n=1 Tax=Tritonibacter mobilis TaxID=379347 RepID=UPI000806EEF0|nr:hypothetical protein [Tritonibacter mobilis]